MSEPTTEAGKRLGPDVEQELGLQFKSRDAYEGWLSLAGRLAVAIEDEAVAAERQRIAAEVEGLWDGRERDAVRTILRIVNDESAVPVEHQP